MNAIVEIDKAGRIRGSQASCATTCIWFPANSPPHRAQRRRLVFEQGILRTSAHQEGWNVVSPCRYSLRVSILLKVLRQGYAERMERILEGSGLE